MDALAGVEVVAQRHDEHHEVVFKLLRLQVRHDLGALVGDGAYVEVVFDAALTDQPVHDVAELFRRESQAHPKDLGAGNQALEVLDGAEDIELLLLFVPVAANSLEAGRAVVKGVRRDRQLGLGERDDFVLEKGVHARQSGGQG